MNAENEIIPKNLEETGTDKTLSVMSDALPIGSLEAYIQRMNDIPMLTAEEEFDLSTRYRKTGDLQAAQKLVLSHLKFVVKVSRGYLGYGLPLADLIQEGTVGLMKAVKRFDPNLGVRLVSFAVHWIKAEMHEYILRNWRIVKVATTKAQRKLFFNLRGIKKRLGWSTAEEVETIADELNVSAAEVYRMEERLNARDVSFDLPVDAEDDERAFAPVQYLEDPNAGFALQLESDNWNEQRDEGFRVAFEQLDPRSRDILEKRWLVEKKATLQELADFYQISAERIRQLENNAILKLKKLMTAA